MEGSIRILLIGDSLGLPRTSPETVGYEDAWPSILKKKLPESQIETLFLGGAKINELHRQIEYYKAFNPHITIVQSGIVDCAPRALTIREKEILNRYWVLRKLFLPVLLRCTGLLRKLRNKRYTKPRLFKEYLRIGPSEIDCALALRDGQSKQNK